MPNAAQLTATIHVHICAERRGYNVTFSTEDQLIAYLTPRNSTHTWWELAAEDHSQARSVPVEWRKALDFLYPMCEHGMGLDGCYGPDHFMSADQERAMGWDYMD
jgi:hypothetical protein